MSAPRLLLVLIVASLLAVTAAGAGHEMPFYPSFYPQEIKIEPLSPAAAAARLRKPSLHAYVGADPFAGATSPPHVVTAESFDSYVVLTFNRAAAAVAATGARCAAAARVQRALWTSSGNYVFHPYPVTPYAGDYIAHVDLVGAARRKVEAAGRGGAAAPRIKASGRWAEMLRAAGVRVVDTEADAEVEEVSLAALLGASGTPMNGWSGPPWAKDGWFHAYLLHADSVSGAEARRSVESALARRVAGGGGGAERINLERRLVSDLTRGCERVSIGYTLRREVLSNEYSDGVENIGWDSQRGLDSAIFVRTVKLKDFPWNGWLQLGVEGAPAAAWNPIAGFSDRAGRLVWAAIGDPALLPSPYGSGWVDNRVKAVTTTAGPVAVPADALAPERTTGALKPAGAGVTAASRVVYRVLTSKFHDDTKMTVADILYPYAFAYRWASRGAATYDPEVERATALLRDSLVAFKVVKVDTEIKEMGEIQLVYDVPQVDVYLRQAPDAREAPAVAPPWSPVPWQVTVLAEEAVARGLAAFSETEARRRGLPWLDLARDRKIRDALVSLAEGFERRAYVPPALRGLVTVEQARQRWAALRRFVRTHGHFLVTSGPYRLGKSTGDAVVLGVFRDLTYPLGVGSWDPYALPRRAWVVSTGRRGDRLEITAEVDTITRFERSYKITREPYRPQPAGEKMREAVPVARYVVVDGGDEVVAAGTSDVIEAGRVVVDLTGRVPRPGSYRVMVGLSLNGNVVNGEVRVIPYRVAD